MNTQEFKQEITEELTSILQYWMSHTVDEKNGGFIGRIDNDNKVYPEAPKGSVLNARILWSFSAAYTATKNKAYLRMAQRAYSYIQDHFIDKEYGGVFWSVDYKGNPLDTKKQIYALAFTIYACSEYYKCTAIEEAKQTAIALYNLIQKYSYDAKRGGYLEAFARNWEPMEDSRLSDKDANEKKTMNTHLHILEAYTNLYRIWPDEKLGFHQRGLLTDFLQHILNQQTGHLHLFFDENWKVKGETISYGHDIEASWLLLEAAEILQDETLIAPCKKIAVKMTAAVVEGIDTDGGLWYEYEPGTSQLIKQKHWWPQAEAMIGFINAWQISKEGKYLQHACNSWEFIKQYILDKKEGEWLWGIKEDHSRMKQEDKVGIWKCPYHNARACMEIMKRI